MLKGSMSTNVSHKLTFVRAAHLLACSGCSDSDGNGLEAKLRLAAKNAAARVKFTAPKRLRRTESAKTVRAASRELRKKLRAEDEAAWGRSGFFHGRKLIRGKAPDVREPHPIPLFAVDPDHRPVDPRLAVYGMEASDVEEIEQGEVVSTSSSSARNFSIVSRNK